MICMWLLRIPSSLLVLCAVCCAQAASPAAPVSHAETPQPPAPARMFAPYVDMAKPFNDLPQIQDASGIRMFTLAFVVAGEGCIAAWAGKSPVVTDSVMATYVDKLRAAGGDVIIAFGGYDGLELAQACSDVSSLQAAYRSVVDHYRAKILDMDIEHTAIEDPVSIERRSQALKQLALANPGLQINYTLPATPRGLTQAWEVSNGPTCQNIEGSALVPTAAAVTRRTNAFESQHCCKPAITRSTNQNEWRGAEIAKAAALTRNAS